MSRPSSRPGSTSLNMSGSRPGSGSRSNSSRPLSSSRPSSAGSIGTSDRSTVLLLRELVHAYVDGRAGNIDASKTVHTLRFAIRVVGSKIGPPPSLGSFGAVGDAIVRRIAKQGRHEEASRASYLIQVLRTNQVYNNSQAILQLLDALAASGTEQQKYTAPADPMKLDGFSQGLREDGRQASAKDSRSWSTSTDFQVSLGRPPAQSTKLPVAAPPPVPSAEIIQAASQRAKSEPADRLIFREALYALHSVDGKLVKNSEKEGSTWVSPSVRRGSKGLLLRMRNDGGLLSKIESFCSKNSAPSDGQENPGLVSSAFRAALSAELDMIYTKIAAVEAQAKNSKTWSIRRLSHWVEQSSGQLRLMERAIAACRTLKGGKLATELEYQSRRSDGERAETASRLYKKSCRPLLRMLRKWLAEGVIVDDYKEFFVAAVGAEPSRLWSDKYRLVEEMIPSFIGRDTAEKALIAGKAVDFLRVCCQDVDWVLERASEMRDEDFEASMDGDKGSDLNKVIASACQVASDRVKEIMYGKFRLVFHCESLRSYLLLTRGDFVLALTDALGDDLDKSSSLLLRNNLVGVLETAVRSSAGKEVDSDMERLDVRLLDSSRKETGWDVFRLDYRFTEAPLENFFTERIIGRYMKIFGFLWKLKRAEHYLRGLWEMQRSWNASLADPNMSLFVQCAFLRVKMNHFVLTLEYFLVYEVLDNCWRDFLKDMNAASDLEMMMKSHAKYLENITNLALLADESKPLHDQFLFILELIHSFRKLQEQIMSNTSFDTMQNTKESYVRQTASQDLLKLETDFDRSVSDLLDELKTRKGDDHLVLLALRLDFNNHYSLLDGNRNN